MTALFTRLRSILTSRSPREQRLIVIAVSVIAIALLVVLLEWTLTEQRRVQQQLPEARAQLARMQDDAAELLRLSRQSSAPALDLNTLARTVQASAAARGLTAKVEVSGASLQLEASGPFTSLIDWLAAIQAEQRLRATQVDMNQQGSEHVQLHATLIQ